VLRQAACVGGRELPRGERLTLVWACANRDEAVFGDPDEFRFDRDPALNLLYGAGLHVCPGAELSRMQLRVVVDELLAGTQALGTVQGKPPEPARYPAGGFSELVLRVAPRAAAA